MEPVVINTRGKQRRVAVKIKRRRKVGVAFAVAVVAAYLSSAAAAIVLSELIVRQVYGYSLLEVFLGKS